MKLCARYIPSVQFKCFQMWAAAVQRRARLQRRSVVTCYDPVHLLQRRRQHLTGVRHHLVPGRSETIQG